MEINRGKVVDAVDMSAYNRFCRKDTVMRPLPSPAKIMGLVSDIDEQVGYCVTSSTRHGEMLNKVSELVENLSFLDDTIGERTMSLAVQ